MFCHYLMVKQYGPWILYISKSNNTTSDTILYILFKVDYPTTTQDADTTVESI